MAKVRIFQTEYPENPPDWYWESGLHDACIIGVETYEFPFKFHFKIRFDRAEVDRK